MSQIYAAAFVAIMAQVLPFIGVTVGSEQLTSAVQTIVTIGAAIWVMIRRYRQGDITVGGVRK